MSECPCGQDTCAKCELLEEECELLEEELATLKPMVWTLGIAVVLVYWWLISTGRLQAVLALFLD